MRGELSGKRIAFLVANEGVEQVELTQPWQAIEQSGGQPVLVAPKPGKVRAFKHLDKGATFQVHVPVEAAEVTDYAGLVLPGGVANPDQLRTDERAVEFVRGFVDAGKPIAAICHAPWTLIEADAVRGKKLTSWPSLRTDIRNAGGDWVDEEVVVSTTRGYPLISSRKPDDLPAFCREAVRAFAATSAEPAAADPATAAPAKAARAKAVPAKAVPAKTGAIKPPRAKAAPAKRKRPTAT